MAEEKTTTYSCDGCNLVVDESGQNSEVVIDRNTDGVWSRFHIRIILQTGVHNQSSEHPSDLCQDCAVKLLRQAAKAILSGLDVNHESVVEKEANWQRP